MTSSPKTKTDKRSLPDGWQWKRLGDVCNVVNGFGFPEQFQGKKDLLFPFIKVSDMNQEGAEVFVTKANNTVDDEILKAIRGKVYPAGTVIFPKVGGALLTNKKRVLGTTATFDNNVMGIIPNDVLSGYLYYWMLTVDLKSLSNVQALPSIKQSVIENLQIPLPPLEEQKRIAKRLNEELSVVESARKATEEQLHAAWELPSAYLRQIFYKDDFSKWEKIRLGNIFSLRKEVIHPYDNPKGEAIFVGLEHIESNTGFRIGSVELEMSKLTGRKPKFYKGDIVYGYLRPYLNKVWIAEFDGLCSVDQYVFTVDSNKADSNFIAWFMRSPVYLERAPIGTTPGQLPRIRTEEVYSVEVNLPPLEEQKRISSQISEKLNASKILANSLESQLEEINALPSALLGQAFGGKV